MQREIAGERRPRFEDHLVATGTTIVKFFLYINRDEQRERFQARYDDPTKRWKHDPLDEETNRRYPEYTAATTRRSVRPPRSGRPGT